MSDIQISNDELKALNEATEAIKKKALDDEREKIAKEVRATMELELQAKKLAEDNARLQSEIENNKRMSEEREKQVREEMEKKLSEVVATRQGLVNNKNPFDAGTMDLNLKDPKVQDMIEENSREEFVKKFTNLPIDFGKP